MVPINLNITITLLGIIKQIPRIILLDLKLSKANCAPTLSSVWTAKVIIRQNLTNVLSRDINSIRNSIQRNIKNFMRTEDINLFNCEWHLSMILKDIKIFSQNICKNNFIINTILETQSSFDIIFIQEFSWSFIHSILSLKNKKNEELVGVPNHPNWTTFFRNSSHTNDSPRVITYINVRLSSFWFYL